MLALVRRIMVFSWVFMFLFMSGCSGKKINPPKVVKENTGGVTAQGTYSHVTYTPPKVLNPEQRVIQQNQVDFYTDPQWKETYEKTDKVALKESYEKVTQAAKPVTQTIQQVENVEKKILETPMGRTGRTGVLVHFMQKSDSSYLEANFGNLKSLMTSYYSNMIEAKKLVEGNEGMINTLKASGRLKYMDDNREKLLANLNDPYHPFNRFLEALPQGVDKTEIKEEIKSKGFEAYLTENLNKSKEAYIEVKNNYNKLKNMYDDLQVIGALPAPQPVTKQVCETKIIPNPSSPYGGSQEITTCNTITLGSQYGAQYTEKTSTSFRVKYIGKLTPINIGGLPMVAVAYNQAQVAYTNVIESVIPRMMNALKAKYPSTYQSRTLYDVLAKFNNKFVNEKVTGCGHKCRSYNDVEYQITLSKSTATATAATIQKLNNDELRQVVGTGSSSAWRSIGGFVSGAVSAVGSVAVKVGKAVVKQVIKYAVRIIPIVQWIVAAYCVGCAVVAALDDPEAAKVLGDATDGAISGGMTGGQSGAVSGAMEAVWDKAGDAGAVCSPMKNEFVQAACNGAVGM